MSNGDDVLVDNWEEIDDAGLTNTLQKIQAERKTQEKQQIISAKSSSSATSSSSLSSLSADQNNSFILSNIDFPAPGALAPMKLLQRNANSADSTRPGQSAAPASTALNSPLEDMAADFQPVMMMLHKPADEYQSTTYAQPTHLQTVKILRRPTQSSEPRNNGIRPRQPIKTLQQREQEYAEARLRILGAAKNPEDDVGASNANSSSANATAAATTVSNATATTNTTAATFKGNAAPKMPPSSVVGGGGGSAQNLYNNYYNQQQQQQQQNYFFMQQQQPLPAFNNRTLATGMSPLLPPHTLQHQRQQSPPPLPPSQQHQTWSPIVGGSVSSPVLRQQQQESILRLPRGPDGSNGFQMRR